MAARKTAKKAAAAEETTTTAKPRSKSRRSAVASMFGAATNADEIEEEAVAAGDRIRDNPLSHPDKGEVERAARVEEEAVRASYRRPS